MSMFFFKILCVYICLFDFVHFSMKKKSEFSIKFPFHPSRYLCIVMSICWFCPPDHKYYFQVFFPLLNNNFSSFFFDYESNKHWSGFYLFIIISKDPLMKCGMILFLFFLDTKKGLKVIAISHIYTFININTCFI